MQNKMNLVEAATDLRYLLNRGYNRKSSIELVGNRWNLNRDERHILYRACFSTEEIKARKWNEAILTDITGKNVAIDTYNILITAESLLKGLLVIKGDDDYIRDISKVFNKYKRSPLTTHVLNIILDTLKPFNPKNVLFFLDKDISKSGELAAIINEDLTHFQISGTAETVPSADRSVIMNGEIVISNDRVVLENSIAHLNLLSYLLKKGLFSQINLIELR
ncbi:MAG: DUF434 domain-containing protein [Candidatus Helarchaeota archaeon]